MSSSILTGGTGRAYGFDIENVVKSPSMTSSRTSHSSSPSSTISESSNSPIAISNRKPRTPRKRPNQTYNEAAVLLSIACPKVFSNKNLTNKNHNFSKLTTQNRNPFHGPPELLLPFPVLENFGFLLRQPTTEKPNSVFQSKLSGSCYSPEEVEYQNFNSDSTSTEPYDGFDRANLETTESLLSCDLKVTGGSSHENNLLQKSKMLTSSLPSWPNTPSDPVHAETSCTGYEYEYTYEYEDDFDTESMLDEETEEGIDSIMGGSNSTTETREPNDHESCLNSNNTCYGFPMGLGFGGNLEFNFCFGMRNGIRALKNGDEGSWWSFPTVNVVDISSPVTVALVKVKKFPVEKKKKKRVEELMKRPEKELVVEGNINQGEDNNNNNINIKNGCKLLLKLNYDDVLNAWSDKGSPLPEEVSGSESPGGDIHARLAQIDLFSENGGMREASVMRYKEKKRTRLFSKKIRYQVRKVNADRRPRSKGRFVRRPNSEDTS